MFILSPGSCNGVTAKAIYDCNAMLTVSSGADVPKGKMFKPITRGDILSLAENEAAPLTSQSATDTKIANPTTKSSICISIFRY